MENTAERGINFNLLSKSIVGIITARDDATVKFTKDAAEARNISANEVESAEQTVKRWLSSPLSITKTANYERLVGTVGDILGHLEYPSITLRKVKTTSGVETYEFISEDTGVKVAEFTVKIKELPPKCYSKCYALDFKGKYKRVTGPLFDYFHTEILKFEKLKSLLEANKVPEENTIVVEEVESPENILTIKKNPYYVEETKKDSLDSSENTSMKTADDPLKGSSIFGK